MKNICLGCVLYPNPTLNPPMNMEHAQVLLEDQEKGDGVCRLYYSFKVNSWKLYMAEQNHEQEGGITAIKCSCSTGTLEECRLLKRRVGGVIK